MKSNESERHVRDEAAAVSGSGIRVYLIYAQYASDKEHVKIKHPILVVMKNSFFPFYFLLNPAKISLLILYD